MHLRKNLNFFEEDVLFDFGDDIEISHIETNNGKYTEKEKDILADMELDAIGFSSAPHSIRARKKIREIMVRIGHTHKEKSC